MPRPFRRGKKRGLVPTLRGGSEGRADAASHALRAGPRDAAAGGSRPRAALRGAPAFVFDGAVRARHAPRLAPRCASRLRLASRPLPNDVVWHILSFWRTTRDDGDDIESRIEDFIEEYFG